MAATFQFHPYRNEVIGWKSDLRAITREELYAHYQTYYMPNNAVLVVVGDFQTDAIMQQVEQHFAGRAPHVRRIYDALLRASRFLGPFQEEPKKTSIHLARNSAFVTILLLSTIKFPCRETGVAPSCRLPCPFEWGNPTSGERDISKAFSTPRSTSVTFCAGTPSSSNW